MSGGGLSLASRMAGLLAVRALICLLVASAGAAGWGPPAPVAWGALAYAAASALAELVRRSRRGRAWTVTVAPLILDVVLIQLASAGWDAASTPFAFMGFTHVVAVVILTGHRMGLRIAIAHGLAGFAVTILRLSGVGAPLTTAEVRELAIATFGLLVVAATTAVLGRLVEREEDGRRREVEVLALLGHCLQSLATADAIADAVTAIAVDELGFTRAVVLTDPSVEVEGTSPSLVQDGEDLPPAVAAAMPGARNVVLVALGQPGEGLGVAAFEWGTGRDRIPQRLVDVVQRCCVTTSLALGRAALQAEVHRLATTDALTGLANRRVMQDALDRYLAGARRHGTSLCLLVIDVDHFKAVNDGHGHAVGDEVLSHVGAVLRQSCRESDLPARFGGEEFVVLLPRDSVQSALVVGERLRRELGDGSGPLPITVSIGLAAFPAHAGDAPELFAAADQALYRAKADGRNRLEVADPQRWCAPVPAGA